MTFVEAGQSATDQTGKRKRAALTLRPTKHWSQGFAEFMQDDGNNVDEDQLRRYKPDRPTSRSVSSSVRSVAGGGGVGYSEADGEWEQGRQR
jgi:hypothetical protein